MSDILFGSPPTSTTITQPPLRPPLYDFDRAAGYQWLPNILGGRLPTYPYNIDPGLSPTMQAALRMGQGRSVSPAPQVMGQAAGALGQFMSPYEQGGYGMRDQAGELLGNLLNPLNTNNPLQSRAPAQNYFPIPQPQQASPFPGSYAPPGFGNNPRVNMPAPYGNNPSGSEQFARGGGSPFGLGGPPMGRPGGPGLGSQVPGMGGRYGGYNPGGQPPSGIRGGRGYTPIGGGWTTSPVTGRGGGLPSMDPGMGGRYGGWNPGGGPPPPPPPGHQPGPGPGPPPTMIGMPPLPDRGFPGQPAPPPGELNSAGWLLGQGQSLTPEMINRGQPPPGIPPRTGGPVVQPPDPIRGGPYGGYTGGLFPPGGTGPGPPRPPFPPPGGLVGGVGGGGPTTGPVGGARGGPGLGGLQPGMGGRYGGYNPGGRPPSSGIQGGRGYTPIDPWGGGGWTTSPVGGMQGGRGYTPIGPPPGTAPPPTMQGMPPLPNQGFPGNPMPGPVPPAPPPGGFGETPPTGPASVWDVYRASVAPMESLVQRQIGNSLSQAGLSGNRFSTSAANNAARIGAEAAVGLNRDFMDMLYRQGQGDLDRQLAASNLFLRTGENDLARALQATGQVPGFAGALDQIGGGRMRDLFDMARWEQGRADQLSMIPYQDWMQSRQGFFPNIFQILGATGGATGASVPPITQTQGGSPGALDYASLIPLLMGAFSDERLKKNIRRVRQLPEGVWWSKWEWKWGGEAEGVIAQELREVRPDLVGDWAGILTVNYAGLEGAHLH